MQKQLIVGQMIDFFLKKYHMSRKQLGAATGKSESAVSKWIKGTNTPLAKDLSIMTQLFDTNIETLLYGESQDQAEHLQLDEAELITKYRKVSAQNKERIADYANMVYQKQFNTEFATEVIDLNSYIEETRAPYITNQTGQYIEIYGKASAGSGVEVPERDLKEQVFYTGKVPKHDFALLVQGDSMEPLFKHDEVIFIKRDDTISGPQIGVIKYKGEAFVKKVYLEQDHVRLVSLNRDYQDIICQNYEVEYVGKVVM